MLYAALTLVSGGVQNISQTNKPINSRRDYLTSKISLAGLWSERSGCPSLLSYKLMHTSTAWMSHFVGYLPSTMEKERWVYVWPFLSLVGRYSDPPKVFHCTIEISALSHPIKYMLGSATSYFSPSDLLSSCTVECDTIQGVFPFFPVLTEPRN